MPITNYPQGVASFGVPQIGPNPLLINPAGAVIFVNSQTGIDSRGRIAFPGANASSTNGSTQGPQGNPIYPLATLAYALTFTKAGRGDIIILMAGHAETLAAVDTVANSAVTIWGCGQESERPYLTLSIAAALTISGNGVSIANVIFDASAQSNLAEDILISGTGTWFYNCKLLTHTGTGTGISLAAGWGGFKWDTSSIVNGLTGSATSVGSAISAAAGDSLRVTNSDIRGVFATAVLVSTGDVTDWRVDSNIIRQLDASQAAVFSLGTTTDSGVFSTNALYSAGATTVAGFIVGTGAASVNILWMQNYGYTDKSGGAFSAILVPAAGTIP